MNKTTVRKKGKTSGRNGLPVIHWQMSQKKSLGWRTSQSFYWQKKQHVCLVTVETQKCSSSDALMTKKQNKQTETPKEHVGLTSTTWTQTASHFVRRVQINNFTSWYWKQNGNVRNHSLTPDSLITTLSFLWRTTKYSYFCAAIFTFRFWKKKKKKRLPCHHFVT